MSILSFPDRGQGGDARYRGNCSPSIYEWLIREARATSLLDPCLGSGTSLDVALRLGLRACGTDLATSPYHQQVKTRLERAGAQVHLGVDASTADFHAMFGQVDLTVAHPAYGTQIAYQAGDGDMSALGDGEAFLQSVEGMLHGMREATREDGYYVVIIGDTRKKGRYYSYQAPIIESMPRHELRAVRIKAQHNVSSARTTYGQLPFGLLSHEYILIFQRQGQMYAMFTAVREQQRERQSGTWKTVVRRALQKLGGEATLRDLYATVFTDAPDKIKSNEHYQAKIRQTVQLMSDAAPTARGTWKLAA